MTIKLARIELNRCDDRGGSLTPAKSIAEETLVNDNGKLFQRKKSLRDRGTAVVIAGLLGLLLVLIGADGAEANKINIGYLTVSSGYSVLWVTKEAGFFRKNGLEVELVYIPPALLTQAMLARQVPMAVSGGSSMIEANLRGADFVLLGTLTRSPSLNFLVTRPEVTSVSQLKGKKLGISRIGAAPHRILQLTLTKLNMDPTRDVAFIQIGNPGVVLAAIKDGRVDGGLLSPDYAYAAKKLGLHFLVNLRDLDIEYLTADLATTKSFVNNNEDLVRSFIRSMVEGIQFYKTNKRKSMEVMKKYMKIDAVDVIETGYDWYAESYQRKPYVSVRGVKAVLQHLAERMPKAISSPPEQFYDSSFVRELDNSVFIDNLYN
jgi:ABC-type nitrate/sulfonate/bicarbonate transport system substrate-binding protein